MFIQRNQAEDDPGCCLHEARQSALQCPRASLFLFTFSANCFAVSPLSVARVAKYRAKSVKLKIWAAFCPEAAPWRFLRHAARGEHRPRLYSQCVHPDGCVQNACLYTHFSISTI